MDPILIVAGESSGERYGAGLVREFRKLYPEARFFGIGGKQMSGEGVEVLFPMEHLAVMGIFEVISHVPRIRRIFRQIVQETASRRPAAAVLIDSPDFNLRLARKLKKAGIPVLYYVSPTVWAWRRGRLKTIRKHVARMMLIFPFEEEIYKAENIPATYIGHPLLERVKADLSRKDFFAGRGLDPGKKLVVLLPGSRRSELRSHGPVLAEAVERIRGSVPAEFVLVLAESLRRADLEKAIPGGIRGLQVIDRDGYSAIAAADIVLSACGTATLEAALLGTPVVAYYRISPLTYHVGRRFVRIRQYSIVNILAGKAVIPELIQDEFTAGNLSRETIKILESDELRAEMKADFLKIRKGLGEGRASENAALELEKFIR
ncbi:MAG: lipid-A-disaccharide synthase [Candidatus Aminicenantes bacterium]|nr:lipid-A-disaccharide synthase [Candidatus Aminicenantes bacterium]